MPVQNESLRLKLTGRRRLPRRYSAQIARKLSRKTQENSQGTIHLSRLDIIAVRIPAHGRRQA